jgi:hypothetical protein
MNEKRQVVRVFYPTVWVDLFALSNGSNAEVKVGEPGYQLSTGEIIVP